MGKKKKPPPDPLADFRKTLASLKGGSTPPAQLKTHLHESGVELDPPFSGAAKIAARISRVWATLWGADRKALRLVAVDGNGQLIVRSPRWDLCETLVETVVSGANSIGNIDLKKVVDWVCIDGPLCQFHVEFSNDNTTWRNYRFSRPWYEAAGAEEGRFEGYIQCRYLRFSSIRCIALQTVTAVGEIFPTE